MNKETYDAMREYEMRAIAQRDIRHKAVIDNAVKTGALKKMSWDEFWQMYNQLWNNKQYDALLLHFRMNWNPNWVALDTAGRLAK